MSKAYGTVPMISTDQIMQTGSVITVKNKQGHSCCGCCDVRRAVVVVDLVMIAFLLIAIFGIASFSLRQEPPLDDDELQAAVEKSNSGMHTFFFVLEILLLGVSIWGAVTFSAPKVALGLAVFGIAGVMSLLEFNLPAVLTMSLFAYPHYFLYREIVVGIMSEDNYYNEEQSCCCV